MNKKTYNKLIWLLSSVYVGCLALNAYLYTLPTHTTVWNYLFGIYGLLFLIGGLAGIRGSRDLDNPGERWAFLLWGVGLVCQASGYLAWAYYNFILKIEVPPVFSVADWLYYGLYIFFGFGLWKYYNTLPADGDIDFPWVSALPIITIACLMIVIVLRRPDLSSNLPLITRIGSVTATLGDAFIVSMGLAAIMVKKLRTVGFNILILGLLIFTIADFTFVYQSAKGTFWNGNFVDLIYMTSAYIMSLGIFHMLKEKKVLY